MCGGRDYDNRLQALDVLDAWVARYGVPELVISGGAVGADTWAAWWARQRGYPLKVFPADWARWGKRAGRIRNQQMLGEGKPSHLVAFPGGVGTQDMVGRAGAAGLAICQVSLGGTLMPMPI